jgi:hypothetical protein
MTEQWLLNSEGVILTALKVENGLYEIIDEYKKLSAVLTEEQIQEFIHGDLEIENSKGKKFRYGQFPGTMKPNLKKLDEFIGIDTTNKIY